MPVEPEADSLPSTSAIEAVIEVQGAAARRAAIRSHAAGHVQRG